MKTITKPPKVITERCRNAELLRETLRYSPRETILYALGIGIGRIDPTTPESLRWTYELHDDFGTAPSFVTILPVFDSMLAALLACDGLPEFNPALLLHGEERVILHVDEVPTEGTVGYVARITDVLDKRSGALVLITIDIDLLSDGSDNESQGIHHQTTLSPTPWARSKGVQWIPVRPLCTIILSLFIRGIGGFSNGSTSTSPAQPATEQRSRAARTATPPSIITRTTFPSQAVLYRLCGDRNPLHIDPHLASVGGFSRPILHGLCSFGIATTVLAEQLGGDRPASAIAEMAARFSAPVVPGDLLTVRAWLDLEDVKMVHFEVLTQPTSNSTIPQKPNVCMTQGYIRFRNPVSRTLMAQMQRKEGVNKPKERALL